MYLIYHLFNTLLTKLFKIWWTKVYRFRSLLEWLLLSNQVLIKGLKLDIPNNLFLEHHQASWILIKIPYSKQEACLLGLNRLTNLTRLLIKRNLKSTRLSIWTKDLKHSRNLLKSIMTNKTIQRKVIKIRVDRKIDITTKLHMIKLKDNS